MRTTQTAAAKSLIDAAKEVLDQASYDFIRRHGEDEEYDSMQGAEDHGYARGIIDMADKLRDAVEKAERAFGGAA